MRVVISGGGTAGHAYPAMAVADVLQARGAEIVFIGTTAGPESRLAGERNYRFEPVDISGRSKGLVSIRNLTAAVRLLGATARSVFLLGVIEPDLVLTTGGYVSLPVALASAIQGLPLVVHEQNTVPGLANRIASRFARSVGTAFPGTEERFGSRGQLVGNPVRAEITASKVADAREAALEEFGLAPGRRTLLIAGGSQGARSINTAAFEAYERWRQKDSLQVLHLVGPRNADESEAALAGLRGADDRVMWRVVPYTERMDLAYTVADLAVCRSGATTIFELAASGVPAILVPYPHSVDADQLHNARAVVAAGGAEMILDTALNADTLTSRVDALLSNVQDLAIMGTKIRSLFIPNAADLLADLVWEATRDRGSLAGSRSVLGLKASSRTTRKARESLLHDSSPSLARASPTSDPAALQPSGLQHALAVGWRRVHMVGIGGAGMSAIARILREGGVEVTGSDLSDSASIGRLRAIGMNVEVGHSAERVGDADIVIYSAAVPEDNVEIAAARARGIDVVTRGEALARIVGSHRVVAVSGTHGKTTTSGMLATILDTAGLDCTYVVGADLSHRGPGGKLGSGDIAVVEADEAYGSFLALEPHLAVVTNIDTDHLDYYGSLDGVREAFQRFVSGAEELIVCVDDAHASSLEHRSKSSYGFDTTADVASVDLIAEAHGSEFTIEHKGRVVGEVLLQVAGRRNVQNALGAAAAALQIGVPDEAVIAGLNAFKGLSRRFEYRGSVAGADVIDDYGHHPTEIEATLTDARAGPWSRIVAVFQPHLYSRTQSLAREFGAALANADIVVVTGIYGAREAPIPGVTGKLVAEAACEAAPRKRVAYLPKLEEAALFVKDEMRAGDLVLSLGAGDITTLPERLLGNGR